MTDDRLLAQLGATSTALGAANARIRELESRPQFVQLTDDERLTELAAAQDDAADARERIRQLEDALRTADAALADAQAGVDRLQAERDEARRWARDLWRGVPDPADQPRIYPDAEIAPAWLTAP
ncbi:hypothetical protein [Modestobacter sp. KNN46-3]|uniref:hypothetical protein n=1 Tax=Modestobacter sp. KNN46-3 TaxID=2711218 RepID=UPI0013DF6CDE|nr:hypothetical protein [Modestobacter sp. KNN46-3]